MQTKSKRILIIFDHFISKQVKIKITLFTLIFDNIYSNTIRVFYREMSVAPVFIT